MIAAENKLKPKHALVPYWSPTLKKKGQELHYYNERIKADDEHGDMGVNVPCPVGVPDDASLLTSESLHRKQSEVKILGEMLIKMVNLFESSTLLTGQSERT